MKALEKLELIKDMVQTAIDNGATSVEEVHKSIASLPFNAIKKTGLIDELAEQGQDKHDESIGMVYDAIRDINQKVGQVASDLFEAIEDGQYIAEVRSQKEEDQD